MAKGKSGKAAGFRPVANPDYAKAIHGLRSSGAAGAHQDQRKKRARTRKASDTKSINEYFEGTMMTQARKPQGAPGSVGGQFAGRGDRTPGTLLGPHPYAGLHYFASDGNYGDAGSLAIVDASDWSEDDWEEFENAQDWDKPTVAKTLSAKYEARDGAELTYFAPDGNYGFAGDIAIVDASNWSEDDWEEFENTSDWQSPGIAASIAARRGDKEASTLKT